METIEGVFFREGVFQKYRVAATGIIDTEGLTDLLGHRPERRHFLGKDQVLDLQLFFIGQFVAVAGEDLYTIILEGVVRGGDNHPGIGPHAGSYKCDARSGHRADQ